MATIDKPFLKCDLCTREIYGRGDVRVPADSPYCNAMVLYEDLFQRLPGKKEGETIDLCRGCCLILTKAVALGICAIDYQPLYEAAGIQARLTIHSSEPE